MDYFPHLQKINLDEYASDSAFEKYTSIVLDKADNAFKVVTGQFHDKRDAYEKLSARGMVVRKTFESKIFDWITRNAPNNITAYMMFSTAFSKWKGNNILNDYYVKLLNDIPELNREKIKGDPNSMGLDTVQRESVELDEVGADQPHYIANPKQRSDSYKLSADEKYANANIGRVFDKYTWLRDVRVTPRNQNGSLSKLAAPLEIKSTYADVKAENPEFTDSAFIDPDFLKAIFNKVYVYHTGEAFPEWAPFVSYEISVDNKPVAELTKTRLPEVLKAAITREKDEINKALTGTQNKNDVLTDKDTIENIKNLYKKAVSRNQTDRATELYKLLRNTKRAAEKEPANNLDMATYKAAEEVKGALSKLSTALVNKDDSYTLEDLNKVIDSRLGAIRNTLNQASEFERISDYYKDLQKTQALLQNAIGELTKDSKTQENVRVLSGQLKAMMDKVTERGIPSKNATAAKYAIKSKDTDDTAKAQRQADLYSNPRTSPSNPIRGGDTNARFFDKIGANLKPKKQEEVQVQEEAHVNDGATVTYLSTPKQPVMQTKGIIQTAGTFVEEEGKFNPVLFDGDTLKSEVRLALLRVAGKFEDKLDLELKPVDIYLTGSNANYNYNDASDIDLHLVYNYEDVGPAAEIFKRYLVAQKKVFNSDYDIFVKGIKVEVGAEDINNPLVAGGVYSLVDNTWKVRPEQMPEVTDEFPPYMNELINEIESAIQSHDSEVIGNLWKSLGELRKASLAEEGEFGSGNLMFKKLRADGYLERLKDAYYGSASKELSLESLEEI